MFLYEQKMPTLKDCPFCGSPAKIEVNSAESWAIYCQNTKCRVRMVIWVPEKYPKGVWNEDQIITRKNWLAWALMELAPKWNARFVERPKERAV